jgi:hypothetical protein
VPPNKTWLPPDPHQALPHRLRIGETALDPEWWDATLSGGLDSSAVAPLAAARLKMAYLVDLVSLVYLVYLVSDGRDEMTRRTK